MGLCQGLSLVRGAKERVISQRRQHTEKWQCLVFHSDGLVLRGSEDYLSSCTQHHHSASENNLVRNLYFSVENIWESSYYKSQHQVYHRLR